MRKWLAVLCLLSLLITQAAVSEAIEYRVIDLGPGQACAINNGGQVVGYMGQFQKHAFLWQNGQMTDLGTFGGIHSYAEGINNSGQVVGYYVTLSDGRAHAFLWQNGQLADLGEIANGDSIAHEINDNGQIVISSGRMYLWQDGQTTEISRYGDSRSMTAHSINNSGQVVGSTIVPGSVAHAFLWQDGQMTDLGTLEGNRGYATTITDDRSYATAINDNGQVVGYSRYPNGYHHAFLWQEGTMTDLGTLGGSGAVANGINDNGQIVGWSDSHAFLWQNGQMTDLGTFGGNMTCALGINENGWIVGYSYDRYENYRAIIWQPVPEPSSVLALLCGVGGLGGMIWRKRSA